MQLDLKNHEDTRTTSGPTGSCRRQRTRETRKRKWTHPICRFVEGACVMTELDCGDGMACWITTLVSWFGILVFVSWWDPGPAIAPPTVLCMEIFCEKKGNGRWWKKMKRNECFILVFCSTGILLEIWKYQQHEKLLAPGKSQVNRSCYNQQQ